MLHCSPLKTLTSALVVFAFSGLFSAAAAQDQTPSFTDVPKEHPAFEAIEFLKESGFISGYEDGTYKPDKPVNRAEAVKIIVGPIVTTEALQQLGASPFSDVPIDAWFRPYVEAARMLLGIVDGPPNKPAFLGANPVLKAEFFKLLFLANKDNPTEAFSEIRLPVSPDVTNPDEWFYPYMRYAITTSTTTVNAQQELNPGRQLTRSDVAIFMFRYIMYKQGRRTQALLSEAENEIIIVLKALEQNDLETAQFASARALLASRGAHARQPDIPLVQGALKTSESFRSLVRGYQAGTQGDLDEVIRLAGEAWNLSSRALELSPDLRTITEQVQKIAKNMADSARALQGGALVETQPAE